MEHTVDSTERTEDQRHTHGCDCVCRICDRRLSDVEREQARTEALEAAQATQQLFLGAGLAGLCLLIVGGGFAFICWQYSLGRPPDAIMAGIYGGVLSFTLFVFNKAPNMKLPAALTKNGGS